MLIKKTNYEAEKIIFERTFDLINSVFDEDGVKKYNITKEKFLGSVLVGSYEVIIPGLTNKLEFFEKDENKERLKDIVKSIYEKTEYNSAVKRGVRSVTRLKKYLKIQNIGIPGA